jgi:NAD(P)-dependent dehydrogenase (short-subunit alcohol dehydrogenase family)
MSNQRVVLITGASSGVGQSTARLLSQRGYRVFGTSRDPAVAEPIPGVEMLPLDVRADDSARACLDAVTERAGRLDILVNNAGYELAGALEESSVDEAKAQFETNFFGIVRMVKAVLPVMRRQGNGQIITISSLSGMIPIPFMGIYSASKFAVEGYIEALRHELKPFHIHVSLIEPGFLHTAMSSHRQTTAARIAEYEPWRQRSLDAIRAHEDRGPGPELVAMTVLRIAASSAPRLRYLAGRQARVVTGLRRFLPEGAFERGARGTYRLDRK